MLKPEFTSPHRTIDQITHQDRQRSLPSLQEVIKSDPAFHPRTKLEDDWEYHSNFLVPDKESTPVTSSSPLQPVAPLVSSTDLAFEEQPYYSDCSAMLSSSSGWTSAPYSNASASFPMSTTAVPAYCSKPIMNPGRSQQNLPSLNDMNLPGSSPVYAGRPVQMSRQYAPSQYFNGQPSDSMDISYTKSAHVGYGTPYNIVTTPRNAYQVSGCQDWSPVSENYYYTNGQSWPPTMQCSTPAYVSSDASSLSGGRRRRGNLPKAVTDILRAWFNDHLDHPYPTEEDKQALIRQTSLSISQISNWFINARRRHWPQMKQNRENTRSVSSRGHC